MRRSMGYIFLIFIGLISSVQSQAQVASFTSQEIQANYKNIHQIAAVAADCLDWHYQDHLEFYNRWGVSKYYGNRRPDYKTKEGLVAALKLYKKPVNLVEQLEPISCIGLATKCLREGFSEVGMSGTWEKINEQLAIGNKFLGTDLQKNLISLGWKSYYWNPEPEMNQTWDLEDQELNPIDLKKFPDRKWNAVWGGHLPRYIQATQKGYYYEKALVVHDAKSLVGFGDVQPAFFKEIPFFVGIAHAGYHVFPGRNGEVIEAHSMRNLNAKDNLEFSEFNPLKMGGGPKWTRTEKYRSGLIVVPNL